MNAIEELNPECFTYDNYELDFGHRLGIYHNYFGEIFQQEDFIQAVKDKIIGWCDPSRLSVRPREDGAAIMCEDEDGKFWFHILNESAEKLGIPSKGKWSA
jgi:hypothetical protein